MEIILGGLTLFLVFAVVATWFNSRTILKDLQRIKQELHIDDPKHITFSEFESMVDRDKEEDRDDR